MYERLEAETHIYASLLLYMMKVEIWPFDLGYSHGEGGGAEDLLVLHLLVGHEHRAGRRRTLRNAFSEMKL